MIKIDEIKNICVIGDGGWGTTLTVLLAKKGFNVTVWGAFPEYLEILKSSHENAKFLPGVRIPDSVKFTASLQEALKGNDIVVLAVPSQYMRGVLTMLKMEDLSDKIFVSVTKGIENDTLKRMSEVVSEVLGERKLVVLSGPTIALEVANGSPSTAVAASRDLDLAVMVQDIFITDRFRIYASYDLIGVEVGGSLKNIIAIAAGALDAMGFGTNAKAALLTRGLVEMVRLGVAMGGRAETFYGLSGLGDLMTTCISQYSRNRWLGEEIGKGKPLKDILKETDMVVEGVVTAKSAFDLAKRYEVDMPITCEIYKVLYENKDPKKAVHDLMTRPSKIE
ncbi:MAG: NAD(P)-dependent glycerol-3-phosphate dehydrogenase [Candidatus Omnitrophica bacterium]|nr:NAD(P)-dependent glycerol-3-phosphate dehydrogenase [Candidatus Omnitrophota bacterium]MBU0895365.1 NAD(P)-dependent glycerol-3-phosphate dehydrogenase [Candidatus Omnitrophota bacterium]MBU1808338.1 NAD(P)-dependent glycerol-3-phosphate dehydrogenase [Candidatus Omnitrophota bacterium]